MPTSFASVRKRSPFTTGLPVFSPNPLNANERFGGRLPALAGRGDRLVRRFKCIMRAISAGVGFGDEQAIIAIVGRQMGTLDERSR